MARYFVAAVILSVYIAGTSWIVRSTGQAYRAKLNGPGVAASRSNVPRSNPTQATEPSPAPATTAATTSTPATPLDVPRPVPASDTTAEAKPKEASPPSPALASVTKPITPEVKPSIEASKAEVPSSPETINPAYAWADSLDLSKISIEDERRLGREVHQLILAYNQSDNAGEWEQRVDRVARPLLNLRSRKDLDYTFTILESDAVNAFSTLGGYIYISRGLFNLIGEDEDYALEFVIGHEIAHVDLKHALKCVAPANVEEKKHGLGTIPQFYLLIAFAYPDKQVFEADTWVFKRMMVKLDRSRHDSLAFLRKFEDYATKNKFKSGRQLPPKQTTEQPGEAPASFLENHFRAETAAWKRLEALKELTTPLTIPVEGLPKEKPTTPPSR